MNWNPVNENFRELASSIHSEFIQLVEQQFGAWILFPSNVAQLDGEVAHDTCPKYLSVPVSKRLRGQYICRSQGKIKIITSPIDNEYFAMLVVLLSFEREVEEFTLAVANFDQSEDFLFSTLTLSYSPSEFMQPAPNLSTEVTAAFGEQLRQVDRQRASPFSMTDKMIEELTGEAEMYYGASYADTQSTAVAAAAAAAAAQSPRPVAMGACPLRSSPNLQAKHVRDRACASTQQALVWRAPKTGKQYAKHMLCTLQATVERGDQTLEEVAENGETALVRFTAATVLCALSRFSFHIKVPTLEGAYMVRAGFGPIVCIPVKSNGTTATLCVMKKSKSDTLFFFVV